MGLKPMEVKALTLCDFDMMLTGYQERMEDQWDMTRHVMWSVINYGGMGVKKAIPMASIMSLNRDKANRKRYIVNEFQAIELIKTFYNA